LVLFNDIVSKNDEKMLKFLRDMKILNAFKGPVVGFGKQHRVAVLFSYEGELEER
jgi:hypothetical protein